MHTVERPYEILKRYLCRVLHWMFLATNLSGVTAQGYPVQGPGEWVKYRTQDTGQVLLAPAPSVTTWMSAATQHGTLNHPPLLQEYYHNHRTGETNWDPPLGWR
jgi:hypothetical protein